MIFPALDIVGQYSFWRSFFASSTIAYGQIPLWNPYVFSGSPFIGDPLSGMFYPFTWIFLIFNSDVLFGYLFFVDVLLLGIFTYLFGRTIKLDKFPALISAIVFMFSGAIIPRIFAGHLSNLDAIVWFPLVLIFFERSFQHNRTISGLCAGIPLALSFLTGNIQFALYSTFAATIYLILRTVLSNEITNPWEKLSHIIVVLLTSFFVCGLLSAIQLLPTWEYAQLSNRGGGVSYDFSSEISLPPQNLFTIFIPDLYGSPATNSGYLYWELSFYVGILPLFFAFFAVFYHKTKYRIIFGFMAAFAILFSLGEYFPAYSILFQTIPGFSMVRIPSSMLFLFSFSVAILAGCGCEVITKNADLTTAKKPNEINKFYYLLIICSFLIVISMISAIEFNYPQNQFANLDNLAIFSVLFCISICITGIAGLAKINVNYLKIFIIIIIVSDLFFFGARLIDTKPPEKVFENPQFISIFKNESDTYFRIYDDTGAALNQEVVYRNNLYLVNGYDPTYLKNYQIYFLKSQYGDNNASYWWTQGSGIKDLDILRQLNVRYIITTHSLNTPGLNCVYNNTFLIYRLNETYPRAYVIPASEFYNKTPVEFASAQIIQYLPNTIVIHSNISEKSYLITSEISYPGWTAYDNNQTTEIDTYHGIFRSVLLVPGEHTVRFTYFPKILSVVANVANEYGEFTAFIVKIF